MDHVKFIPRGIHRLHMLRIQMGWGKYLGQQTSSPSRFCEYGPDHPYKIVVISPDNSRCRILQSNTFGRCRDKGSDGLLKTRLVNNFARLPPYAAANLVDSGRWLQDKQLSVSPRKKPSPSFPNSVTICMNHASGEIRDQCSSRYFGIRIGRPALPK